MIHPTRLNKGIRSQALTTVNPPVGKAVVEEAAAQVGDTVDAVVAPPAPIAPAPETPVENEIVQPNPIPAQLDVVNEAKMENTAFDAAVEIDKLIDIHLKAVDQLKYLKDNLLSIGKVIS